MNKKQRAVIIIWVIFTGIAGITAADGGRGDMQSSSILWVTATLMAAALFWMFKEKRG
jgi:hypothetical protein